MYKIVSFTLLHRYFVLDISKMNHKVRERVSLISYPGCICVVQKQDCRASVLLLICVQLLKSKYSVLSLYLQLTRDQNICSRQRKIRDRGQSRLRESLQKQVFLDFPSDYNEISIKECSEEMFIVFLQIVGLRTRDVTGRPRVYSFVRIKENVAEMRYDILKFDIC